jgi:hypothetical protein
MPINNRGAAIKLNLIDLGNGLRAADTGFWSSAVNWNHSGVLLMKEK